MKDYSHQHKLELNELKEDRKNGIALYKPTTEELYESDEANIIAEKCWIIYGSDLRSFNNFCEAIAQNCKTKTKVHFAKEFRIRINSQYDNKIGKYKYDSLSREMYELQKLTDKYTLGKEVK